MLAPFSGTCPADTARPAIGATVEATPDIINARLKEVDAVTELGVFVGFKAGPWSTALSFSENVSDEHDGYLGYLKVIEFVFERCKLDT